MAIRRSASPGGLCRDNRETAESPIILGQRLTDLPSAEAGLLEPRLSRGASLGRVPAVVVPPGLEIDSITVQTSA